LPALQGRTFGIASVTSTFCWAHGRRKLIAANPKKGSPIVDEALLRVAALYKVEDAICGTDPGRRRTIRQELSRPSVDQFFAWLAIQAARVSRKSDLGGGHGLHAPPPGRLPIVPRRRHIDIDSNLVENAIHSPAMNRRNALFAGHDEGGRNSARFARLVATCKMNGVEPYAHLHDLFIKLANCHLAKDIDALMPRAYAQTALTSE
jgi:transposase